MSLINEYRETEEAINELRQRLANLQNNDALKKELEFESKLKALMAEYGKNLRDMIAILDPQSTSKTVTKPGKAQRAPRELKRYKNPHTGEVVETKGGNHTTLKAWKAKFGADTVKGWVV
ncbi:histone-like nucleoid-structuring protein, MvaT/MvaU family [Pseudomonas sp. NCHU5208]|uniref:histone-like nucleoid-structuring protein, MvaT/MvaU family n=1 Tax=unclassified Pseudomonas TaxID=196821 RepID=UPI003F9D8150